MRVKELMIEYQKITDRFYRLKVMIFKQKKQAGNIKVYQYGDREYI